MENTEKSYQIWNRIDKLKGNLTLNGLAEKVDIKYQQMKEQRSSGRVPSAEDLYRISKALNTTMEYLYAGEVAETASEEARLVDEDPDLQALVRAVSRDRSLLRLLSGIIQSAERSANIG